MGRVKKYESDAEARKAQKEQIQKSNKKYQEERKKFKNEACKEQIELAKILNKYVVYDFEFIRGTLKWVKQFVDDCDSLVALKKMNEEMEKNKIEDNLFDIMEDSSTENDEEDTEVKSVTEVSVSSGPKTTNEEPKSVKPKAKTKTPSKP
jgi:hypothetical protein